MTASSPIHRAETQWGFLRPALWVGLMLLACLSVVLVNGKPLFYYDSAAYIDQGGKILDELGLVTGNNGAFAQNTSPNVIADSAVSGSRSAVYSVFAAMLVQLHGVGLIPLANMVLLILAVSLTVGALASAHGPELPTTLLIAGPLLVASAGSLPFYVAYVMPDMLTGILLLMIAVLTVYSQRMNRWELLAATSLGALAVVSHISHIAIAAAMIPVVVLMAIVLGNRKWWLPTGLVILMVLAGLGERLAFRVAAKSVAGAEVVYIPFLTARLIEDGPGSRYLAKHCPETGLQTCSLFDALSKSDDPMRLTASHIIFETKPHLGSFKLLSTGDQAAVAREQYGFFFRVFGDEPFGTLAAIVRNTARQASMNSIEMTIPTDHILSNTHAGYPTLQGEFSHGRLSLQPDWLPAVNLAHTGVYILSLLTVGLGLFLRSPNSKPAKGFAIVVMLGIAANAFVCGAVSQPADRYGARVIWLLPFVATLLVMLLIHDRRRATQ